MVCKNCGYRDDDPDRSWELRIQKQLLSLNEVGTNAKGNAGRKYRGQRKHYIRKFGPWASHLPLPTGHRQVIVTRQYRSVRSARKYPARSYDWDNLVGGSKPLVDALRKSGLLLDDNPKNVTVAYRQEPSGTKSDYVLIEIQEFDRT